MNEADIQATIRLEASRRGMVLFRNNCGKVQGIDKRWHVFGLCVGSSDLIGWKSVTITEQHVGLKLAVFVAVEVKARTGRVRPEQQQFIDTVAAAGGIAVIARGVDDLPVS